ALVPERVWREVAKGLQTTEPARMFEVLQQAGALGRVMPGLVFDDETSSQLACAVQAQLTLPQRFALLCRKSSGPEQVGRHVRAPGECIDYARLLPAMVDQLAKIAGKPPDAESWLDLIERNDGLRKPQRFLGLLQAAQCVAPVDVEAWGQRLDAVRGIDAGAVAKAAGGKPDQIKAALRQARLDALRGLSQA